MGFLLTNQFLHNSTQVPNSFIDTHMPHANGSFVKVYLFLLRHTGSSSTELTIETMADMLSNTEADIIRALRYWAKQDILSIEEKDGEIIGISLLSPNSEAEESTAVPTPDAVLDTVTEADAQSKTDMDNLAETAATAEVTLPKRQTYSPLQAEALKKDAEIDSCLSMVEALLGTTMGDAHMQLILYLMSDLGFSLELVITLYETALSRGKSKPRYIETIALDWAKKNIQTPQAAEDEASSFNGMYRIASKALGIHRTLAPAEKKIIDQWETFKFAPQIIEEACSRTVLQSGDTNLNYTTTILQDWHTKGVTTLKDIEECDKSYFRQKNITGKKTIPQTKNKFQNFPQRDYSKSEYADLEKQLLHQ